jgi:DNA-binding transcriptional LysR family regulator
VKKDFTKTRGRLDAVHAFLSVARKRSFRAAASELGISPSALSQTIKALERDVGVALFARTTRSVNLTEAGRLFLEQAAPAMEGLEASFAAVESYGSVPSGLLRINASRGVMSFLVEPVLNGFVRAYPDVDVELFADDGISDIVEEGFDAGIRLGDMVRPDMVAVRLSPPFRFAIAASPDYLERRGRPGTPEELREHDCIRFRYATSGAIARWEFVRDSRDLEIAVDGQVIVNDTAIMVTAALQGAGLVQTAEPLLAEHFGAGRLVSVLEDYWPATPGVFLYYPSRSQALPKLRAFVDFMRNETREQPALP